MKFIISALLLSSSIAMAWGERGHNTVGYAAALATDTALTPEEKLKLGPFFNQRTMQFGHLNNIPDISWKDPRNTLADRYNVVTHILDVEFLLGPPAQGYTKEYQTQIRQIEKDFKKLSATFDGKPTPLPGAKHKTLLVRRDLGSAPWRAQELFDLMVKALTCAHQKPKTAIDRKNFRNPILEKNGKIAYSCTAKSTRAENIYAAIMFGGVMGHFIADIAQPLHCSADYDGWITGQGGLHVYFETFAVHAFDEEYKIQVINAATQASTNQKIWNQIGADPKAAHFVTQTMLNLAADSIQYHAELTKLDREYALIKESEKLPWGAHPIGKTYAERKPFTDSKVLQKFKPIAIQRMTVGSVVLSRLWIEAWRKAGSPDLSDINLIAIPYPLDVPFLIPSYL